MAGDFAQVRNRFWIDEKVRTWSDDAKLLALYVLTGPHTELEGIFRLPHAYMIDDLRWPSERLGAALAELQDAGFVKYDDDAQVIFVCHALRYHEPQGPKAVTGAMN